MSAIAATLKTSLFVACNSLRDNKISIINMTISADY